VKRVRYLAAGLALTMLLVAGAGVTLAYSQMGPMMGGDADGQSDDRSGSMMGDNGVGSTMGGGQTGSMMNHGGTDEGQMMGSFDEQRPFDLQFIDQMIMHHEGAIVSSEHMIADSERPELRELAENIQESQSEQIEQMREWREEWYGNAERTFGMMDPTQMDEMMSDGMMEEMMGGSMQEMMGGDTTDAMFLRMMIPHHQVAIDMSERALEEAEHPELKKLAQKIIDDQSAEIELMQGYLEKIETSSRR
jgi:uncharacterized protein (DUF305 family)